MLAASIFSGSSALQAEALHDAFDGLSDWISRRSDRLASEGPSGRFTLGRGKAVALAALGSSVTMLVTAAGVVAEGLVDLLRPASVNPLVMALAPLVSLAANFFIARGFNRRDHGHGDRRLHAEGSMQHALNDAKASLAVVATAGLIEATGWVWADAVVAATIAWSAGLRPAWKLARRSVNQLMDAAPIDPRVVERAIRNAPGVRDVGALEVTDPNCDGGVRVRASVQLEDGVDPGAAGQLIDPHLRRALESEHAPLISSAYAVVPSSPGPLYESLPPALAGHHAHGPSHGAGAEPGRGRHRAERRWRIDLSGFRIGGVGRHRPQRTTRLHGGRGRHRRDPERDHGL